MPATYSDAFVRYYQTQPQYLLAGIAEKLDAIQLQNTQILAALNALKGETNTIMVDLTNLTAQVTNEVTVEQSAITLINGLAAQIQQLAQGTSNDPAVQTSLNNLATEIQNSATALAQAVTANTPAAPAAPPTPS